MNDRARVPFAFVGILLLLSSVTLTTTTTFHDSGSRPSIDRAIEDETNPRLATAIRRATSDAAAAAAASPVTNASDTTAGRALNDSRPFRDALRLRVYLQTRRALEKIRVRRGAVFVSTSLPPVESTTAGYRAAIERIHLERVGRDDAALRITVEGVTVTATRNGRTVTRTERSPSLVVATPVLQLHDRLERFEARANAPVTQPGLGRRLTARLYPLVWVRGYAQYGGAPIGNVLATRHVEFASNDALLAEQREVFGTSDPTGRSETAAAGRRVAVTDLLSGAGGDGKRIDEVLRNVETSGADSTSREAVRPSKEVESPPELTVQPTQSANRAYTDLIGIGSADELTGIIDDVHTVQTRVDTVVETSGVSRRAEGRPRGSWTQVDESTDRRVTLRTVDGEPPSSRGWSNRDSAVFAGTVTESVTRTWERDDETRTGETVVERSVRVRVAVQARTLPVPGAERGSLDGQLAGATERAAERALGRVGGLRTAARRAALDDPPTGVVNETASLTVGRERVVSDVRSIHDRVRNVTTTLPAATVAGGRANPPHRLRKAVAERRSALHGPSGSDVENRTLRAVRIAYLDAVEDRLATRAKRHATANDGIVDAVARYLDADRLDGALSAHRRTLPHRTPERQVDPAGPLTLSVETAPGFLSTSSVDRERIDVRGSGSIRPLATRNVNVFVTPHGQVASSVVSRLPFVGTDRVSLRTAAQTLAATENAGRRRPSLEESVESAADHVRGELRAAMVDEGVPEHAAGRALETGKSTAIDALILANGSVVERSVRAIDSDDVDRERLRLRLDGALRDALRDSEARPPRRSTNDTAAALRRAYREEFEEVTANGVETASERARKRALGKRMGSLPAGLPLAPIPGHWYATGNVWYVEVAGTYERVSVRANRGGPSGAVTYLRNGRGSWVTHAGERRRLGSAERVSFRTETAVAIVVPPGGSGVGDTNGVNDEHSPGWPP